MSELQEHLAENSKFPDLAEATVPAASRPEVTGAVRYLLDRWELSSGRPLPKIIAVVSALNGEGVTTVSRSLAEVLSADASNGVCWIDLSSSGISLKTPTRSARLEGSTATDNSQDVASSDVTLIKSEHPTIRLLSRGDYSVGYSPTLPGRPALFQLLDELAKECDYVVLDMPPVLSESQCLGVLRGVDAYILVTHQGSTTVNQVGALAEELRAIPLLGAVLNDYRTRTPRFIRRLFSE